MRVVEYHDELCEGGAYCKCQRRAKRTDQEILLGVFLPDMREVPYETRARAEEVPPYNEV